jgi:hypothetical protein
MKGVYQTYKEKHLHRYLPELDFRFSNRGALGIHDGNAQPCQARLALAR